MQPTEKRFENVYEIDGMNIILTRNGQNYIGENDEVVVKTTLELPGKTGYLNPELRFLQRVKIFGESLIPTWGNELKTGVRYATSTHKAITWQDAFNNAEKYAFHEALCLKKAISARNQALLDAEKEI